MSMLLLAGVGPVMAQAGDQEVTINYFQRFVVDGGVIAWFLILLSIATFALILEHALNIRSSKLLNVQARNRLRRTLAAGNLAGAWALVNQTENFLFAVVRQGLAEAANSYEAAEYAIIEATEEQATKLLRKIEYLNIIGNVAPMVGLFGTVYGIILAFNKLVEISHEGGVSRPDQLAEGISIALVTTFWGLIVAIPALAMYGLLRNRIDALAAQVANASLEIIRHVKPEHSDVLKQLVTGSKSK